MKYSTYTWDLVQALNKQKQNNQQNKRNEKTKPTTVVPELVALDCSLAYVMCYKHLTLSLIIDDRWLTEVICEVVNPQRHN